MLRQQKHLREGYQQLTLNSEREAPQAHTSGFLIIYIMLTKIIVSYIILTNINRYLKVNINCQKLVNKLPDSYLST